MKGLLRTMDPGMGRLLCIYGAAAVICLLAALASVSIDPCALMAFPYMQIGMFLRWLSLSGTAGNVLAWIVYILLSLIPTAIWLAGKSRRSFLPLFSLLLFVFLYMTVNPAVLFQLTGASAELVTSSMLVASCALILDSLLVLYLVIRLLRYWKQLENRRLVRNLRYFFYAFGFVLVMIIFLQGPADFMKAAEQVRNGNTGITTSDFTLTGLLLVLRTFAAYLPTAAELLLSILAIHLLQAMEKDLYGEKTVQAAELLARVCAGSLVLILGFMVCCNLMNLLFQSGSYDSFFTVNIPLNYIGFSLILLLVSRNLSSGRELKQDYNLFI